MFNQRLFELAKKDDNKLDLCVDLDVYLGTLDIESKYLQLPTIQWLIAQVKLIEAAPHSRIHDVVMEVNVRKNSLCVYKRPTVGLFVDSTNNNNEQKRNGHTGPLVQHTLSNIFKLTALASDPMCFAYFYRKNTHSFNMYTLHAFRSSRANLAQVICDFQMQALRMHESLNYEKVFDFKLVTKVIK